MTKKAIIFKGIVIPAKVVYWFASIFIGMNALLEVFENHLDSSISVIGKITISLSCAVVGTAFVTNERILNANKTRKEIEEMYHENKQNEQKISVLVSRVSGIESQLSPEQNARLPKIEETTSKLLEYGVTLDGWDQIKLGKLEFLNGRTNISKIHFESAKEKFDQSNE